MADDAYSNVRDADILGRVVGARLVDVSQHDADEFAETGESRVYLHFDNGVVVSFPIGDDGFDIDDPQDPGDGG